MSRNIISYLGKIIQTKNYEGMHIFEIAFKRFKYINDYLVNLNNTNFYDDKLGNE